MNNRITMTTNGQTVTTTIGDFIRDNEDMERDELADIIDALFVIGHYTMGGGAMPETYIQRA